MQFSHIFTSIEEHLIDNDIPYVPRESELVIELPCKAADNDNWDLLDGNKND
jgi:hypothetical protein